MIRIDEIYNNTFLPWLTKNRPGTRMYYCDPPGRTDADALFTIDPRGVVDKDFVFFHDQEPVHLDIFKPLFDQVDIRSLDITVGNNKIIGPDFAWPNNESQQAMYNHLMNNNHNAGSFFTEHPDIFHQFKKLNPVTQQVPGHVVVSELGEYTNELKDIYGWQVHYYFYHAWACMDWFRGYDKTFWIPRARDRAPTQTFMSPNRIVAGKRDHRVLFLYNVFKQRLDHNWISAPRTCCYENVDISVVASKYCNIYPDIEQVFNRAPLPKLFPGENTQEMASCWLSNFDQAADSLVYVPTETVYFGQRQHLTEKTFKAIALEMPFVLMAPAHSLDYLRRYGFKTFGDVIDESYDEETNDIKRVEKVVELLKDLDNQSVHERWRLHEAMLPAVEHNYNHFYHGGLTEVLWTELLSMLNGI